MRGPGDRTPEQLRHHYEVERELADRLRRSTRDDRRRLYHTVYDELFRRVPDHSQLRKKARPDVRREYGDLLRLLGRYVRPGTSVLEIGAGDCAISLELGKIARKVYAVDVSEVILEGVRAPESMELVLSDGCSLPVPDGCVDLVFSNQLIEHIHPDDAQLQVRESYRVLRPGGTLLCLTPHRFSGPHDISRHFDEIATGFHLHEYTAAELAALFGSAGFSSFAQIAGVRGMHVTLPAPPALLLEAIVGRLPARARRWLCRRPGIASLFDRLIVAARK